MTTQGTHTFEARAQVPTDSNESANSAKSIVTLGHKKGKELKGAILINRLGFLSFFYSDWG